MGLIVLPLVIFWFGVGVYVLNIGVTLFADISNATAMILASVLAIVSFISYVSWGFSRFKTSTQLSWYDIPLFFTTHKPSVVTFSLALILYWSVRNQRDIEYITLGSVIIMLTISWGMLAGTFGATTFMKHRGIKQIH